MYLDIKKNILKSSGILDWKHKEKVYSITYDIGTHTRKWRVCSPVSLVQKYIYFLLSVKILRRNINVYDDINQSIKQINSFITLISYDSKLMLRFMQMKIRSRLKGVSAYKWLVQYVR